MLAVCFMALGIALGIILSAPGRDLPAKRKLCSASAALQKYGSAALLLLIGVWLGGSPAFWEGLRTAGLIGIALALAGAAGSVLAVLPISRLLQSGDRGR